MTLEDYSGSYPYYGPPTGSTVEEENYHGSKQADKF